MDRQRASNEADKTNQTGPAGLGTLTARWLVQDVRASRGLIGAVRLPSAGHHPQSRYAIRANVLPASRLPKVIEAWEDPKHAEVQPRTAWSLFNAFTEVAKGAPAQAQMEGSLRLS